MRLSKTGTRAWLLSSAILLSYPLLSGNAQAAQHNRAGHLTTGRLPTTHLTSGRLPIRQSAFFHVHQISTRFGFAPTARFSHAMYRSGRRFAARSYGISCVPYAREASGIIVAGNAWQWWDNAEGIYARGDRPEAGSVLNFRANGRMRLGHVAVVTQVVNPREVVVDHANWPGGGGGRGGVSHDVTVVDVSEANNWSAVRVELGRGGDFGSVYPTYGFIYNRPDSGVVSASFSPPAPQPSINRIPSDLRPAGERPWHTVEEVAEAPATPRHGIDLNITPAVTRFGQ